MSEGMKYDNGKVNWWIQSTLIAEYLMLNSCSRGRVSDTDVMLSALLSMRDAYEPFREQYVSRILKIIYPSLSDQYEQVGRVLAFGERKYERDSWQDVPDAYRRYWSAAVRHLIDEEFVPYGPGHIDEESGLRSWAHCATNIEFLMRLEHPNV